MKRICLALGVVMLWAATASAQYLPWHDTAIINSFGLHAAQFASVTVCPSSSCMPVATIYGNSTGAGGAIANPLTADQNGNFAFWAAPGVYFLQVAPQGGGIQTYWISIGGGAGGGSVTNFTAGNFLPLFTTSVANPTTTPALTFATISQGASLFYASPCGSSGNPTFRAICTQDLPPANVPNISKRMTMIFAGCSNGVAASAFDLPASAAMVPACQTDGTNGTVQGVLQAAHSSIAYYTVPIPSDWTQWQTADIWFTTTDTTVGHTIQFTLATACTPPGGATADTPAYNTAQNFTLITIAGSAVSDGLYTADIATVTGTGCAAGSIAHLKLARSGSDTSTDTAVQLSSGMVLKYLGTTN